jgi:uncharacterized protein YdiU (UPF0061 family)
MPGAVFARVAASHIRVGTFQFFAARDDREGLETLTEHVIARHYPHARGPLALLREVVAAQARLIARWMSLGFIHGVMNTDNMSVAGETIDYGPCAFMDAYHPQTVFSSIDRFGRYAYAQQPQVAAWNLAQLATCLLPLMGERDRAIEAATEAVHGFAPLYQSAWLDLFRAKIGVREKRDGDADLIQNLLGTMAEEGADFTATFRSLSDGPFPAGAAWARWRAAWEVRLAAEGADPASRAEAMAGANPFLIPRNHRVEEAIAAALSGDHAPFHRLADALADPFAPQADARELALPPAPGEEVRETFCGT